MKKLVIFRIISHDVIHQNGEHIMHLEKAAVPIKYRKSQGIFQTGLQFLGSTRIVEHVELGKKRMFNIHETR